MNNELLMNKFVLNFQYFLASEFFFDISRKKNFKKLEISNV